MLCIVGEKSRAALFINERQVMGGGENECQYREGGMGTA